MDQLKEQLAGIAKYGFWIGCVVVLISSSWFWYSASTTLDTENAKEKRILETTFQTVSNIQAKLPTHPNEMSHVKMDTQIGAAQEEVLQAWRTLYDRQKEILVWPTKALTEDFVKEFRGKTPIESHIKYPTPENEELASTIRQRYARYIANVLPAIAEIGGTKWEAKMNVRGGAMGRGGDPGMGRRRGADVITITGEAGGPLVKWSSSNQSAVLSDLFPWQSRGIPSSLEIYYSQENLWILRQLMELISQINGAAKQPYQAKIHEINRLGIGRSVSLLKAGNILEPGMIGGGGGRGGMGGMGGMDMGMSMDMDMAMMSGGMGGGRSRRSRKKSGPDPAENRYVDETLKSISGKKLRAAITSDQPSDVALAVAKRVPVMLSLTMDQRAISELLSACGSSKLMIDVVQVRILSKGGSSGGAPGGMPGGDMSGMEEMGGMSGMGGGAPRAKKQTVDEYPLDMNVEVYGIIYIYNPAERKKLGMDAVTEKTVDQVVAKVTGEAVQEDEKDATGGSINDVLPNPGAEPNDADSPDAPAVAPPPAEGVPAPETPADEPATNGTPVTNILTTTPPAIAIGP